MNWSEKKDDKADKIFSSGGTERKFQQSGGRMFHIAISNLATDTSVGERTVGAVNKQGAAKNNANRSGRAVLSKSLVITGDFDRLCAEVLKISGGRVQELTIGYLRDYHGQYLQKTLLEFQKKHAEVTINLMSGTHEELYDNLRSGKADVPYFYNVSYYFSRLFLCT